MSRVGRANIKIPSGVTVEILKDKVVVKGPKGELSSNIRPEIKVEQKDDEVVLSVNIQTKKTSAYWGMTRAIIANMIKGVTEGYEKKLELEGVGYRAKQTSGGVSITLGYSHPVEYEAPEGIEIKVEDNKNITITGINKELVGQTAAKIRSFRSVEPYKGKGVKYVGEIVRRKAGKAGKV